MPMLAATPGHVELHQCAPKFRLKDNDEREKPDDRGGTQHPTRNEQIELVGKHSADAERQNRQRKPERTRLPAPSEQEVDGDGENAEVDGTLPMHAVHPLAFGYAAASLCPRASLCAVATMRLARTMNLSGACPTSQNG